MEGERYLLEVLEVMHCVLGTLYAGSCGERALFRGFEISIVVVFSLQSATPLCTIERLESEAAELASRELDFLHQHSPNRT